MCGSKDQAPNRYSNPDDVDTDAENNDAAILDSTLPSRKKRKIMTKPRRQSNIRNMKKAPASIAKGSDQTSEWQ